MCPQCIISSLALSLILAHDTLPLPQNGKLRYNTQELITEYRPKFSAKGVDIFVCNKEERIHGQHGGYYENFRWIEFVDRDIQPSYQPQRDCEKKEGCTVM